MAKEHGFKIHLNFIGVEKVDLPLARIKERVASGGHGVPEGMVKMRFQHQFLHMDKLLPLLDTAIFYDNTNCMEIAATYYDKNLNIYKPYLSWTNELEHCYENPNPPPKRSAPKKFDFDNFDTVM